jgi:hypothetical protein
MLKYTNKKVIDVQDWDDLVQKTYGKPYLFQQQNGCQPRGIYNLTISDSNRYNDDDWPETVPEKINGEKMGVKFSAWLARDPKEWNGKKEDERFVDMFWERNFYPDIDMVANDLCKKGLIEPGEYVINIDW